MVLGDEENDDPASGPSGATVLDASAILALLLDEPGADTVAEAIAAGATISAVTLAEVAAILAREGKDPLLLVRVSEQVRIETFGVPDALASAALYRNGVAFGLSLGDRACLATARRLRARVLTADSVWARLEIDVHVALIRHT